jgi:hypothetical protein
MEYTLYALMSRADPNSVPRVHNHDSATNDSYVAHGFIMDKMTNLVIDEPGCMRNLVKCYPTPRLFADRALYLLGLLATRGIVHGTTAHTGCVSASDARSQVTSS